MYVFIIHMIINSHSVYKPTVLQFILLTVEAF